MHKADASYSSSMVAAERTLPTAGLLLSGWPSKEPYRQAFSLAVGLPGARVGMVAPQLSGVWGRGVKQKHQGTLNRFFDAALLDTVWMRGPLNRCIAPNAHAVVTLNFPHALSWSHHNHMHDTDTHTNQNECTAEWMGCGRRMVDIPDRLAKRGVVDSRPG